MATAAQIKALFETGDVLLATSFVTFIDSVHPEACDLGTFTGTTITDGGTVKEALQELETAIEAIEGGSGVSDHGELDGLADDDHTQYILATGTRAFSGPVAGSTPTDPAHLATKSYVDAAAVDFKYELKSANFTADPGKIYLVSLATNDVIATVPTTAGACSIVVVEAGTTDPGYGQPLVANKLTIADSDPAIEFTLAADRIDFQSDGTTTVYQIIDDTEYAAVSHTHAIANVIGLQAALDAVPNFLTITETEDGATYEYYGGTDLSGDWKINRFDSSYTKTSATQANNAGYSTLAAAWTDRETLTYG